METRRAICRLLTGILQERDDFGEGFVHRLQSFLETRRPAAADTAALSGAGSDAHQLRCKRLVGERVDDRQVHFRRRAAVGVLYRRLAVRQSQYPEKVDRLRAVDTRNYVMTRVSGLRVWT